MKKYSVVFLPENVQVEVESGSSLLEAVNKANIPLKATCGGKGTCGKCTVKVVEGQVARTGGNLSAKQKAAGYDLACKTKVEGNVVVDIPEESRLSEHQVLLDENVSGLLGEKDLDILSEFPKMPLAKKVYVKLPPATLTENASDLSRLIVELKKITSCPEIKITTEALNSLPEIMRAGEWNVTVTMVVIEGCGEIVRFTAGKDDAPPYGIAVDIGTTTVAVALVDLNTGNIISKHGTYNKQAGFGDDVISRIVYADEDDGLQDLHDAVVSTINELLNSIASDTSINLDDIVVAAVAGNTVMTHMFLGLNPKYIRLEPYIPAASNYPRVKAKELGVKINPQAIIVNFPSIASYVGGDIISGTLVTGLDKKQEVTLFIDIGTNGEMVLGNEDWLMACACSAGPAFEGGGITFGMRAMRGAIERIEINRESFEIDYQTIDNAPAVGVCGSGLIDCLAKLRLAGIVDRSGKLQDVSTPRFRIGDEGPEFVLVWSDESGLEKDIVITESDIKNLIRAKGAIFAGIRAMLNMVQLPIEAIDRILIAGGFGNYLNINDSIAIGLLPDIPVEKYEFIGNSSLKGAHLALLSKEALNYADELAQNMTYLELSIGNMFTDEFVSALFLPHTDLSLFPSIKD